MVLQEHWKNFTHHRHNFAFILSKYWHIFLKFKYYFRLALYFKQKKDNQVSNIFATKAYTQVTPPSLKRGDLSITLG